MENNPADGTASDASAYPGMTPAAHEYLAEALAIMEQNSLHRDRIDWLRLRAEAHMIAQGAVSTEDTYRAIRVTLERLGDHHSFFITPLQKSKYDTLEIADNPSPAATWKENRIAYLYVPGFQSMNPAAGNLYATRLQGLIQELEDRVPCGWIVDLRENSGGNMWSMLAGLGPLLGRGVVGMFIEPGGRKTHWLYQNGEAKYDAEVINRIEGQETKLRNHSIPIAVLTSRRTASSGEAMVVAFHGMPNVRFFGRGTAGQSTANQQFLLRDGSALQLTVSVFADRNGETFGAEIVPDELVPETEGDRAIAAAVTWIDSRNTVTQEGNDVRPNL